MNDYSHLKIATTELKSNLTGSHRGELMPIVTGDFPAMGKTTFALNTVFSNAFHAYELIKCWLLFI